MNRNHDAMTEFCTVHGVVPARNSFRYCPYEVVVEVFNKMVEMGMPKDIVIDAMGSRLWHSVTDYDVWKRINLCDHPECFKRPIFNVQGTATPLFCRDHKSKDMVNVKYRVCAHKDCPTIPSFNVKDSATPLFCHEHKSDEMMNVMNCHHGRKRTVCKDCGSIACHLLSEQLLNSSHQNNFFLAPIYSLID